MSLYPFQEKAVAFHLAHHYSLDCSEMGCLSGDALVKINRGGGSREIRLDELYRKYHSRDLQGLGRKRERGYSRNHTTRIRGFDGVSIRLLTLVGVVKSGVRDCVRVALSCGKRLDVTKDHEILTTRGWIAASDLQLDDSVATDVLSRHMKTGTGAARKKLRYSLLRIGPYHPHSQGADSIRPGVRRIEKHRAMYEAAANGLALADFRRATYSEDLAHRLIFINPRTHHIHHRNGDPKDNGAGNLECLTIREHLLRHTAKYETFKHGAVFWSKVSSVAEVGARETYDLKVEAPHHNFVANGLVVHNCGKSRIALETSRRAQGRTVVFGPAFLRDTWLAEAEAVGVGIKYLAYSMIHHVTARELSAFDFWVADECHMLKSPTAKRSDQFHTLLDNVRPRYFIGLTGTPIKNRVVDFWTLLAYCSLDALGTSGKPMDRGYYAFAEHFCSVHEIRIQGRKIRRYGPLREDRLPDLVEYLRDKYIKFRLADVLPDLPPVTRKQVSIANLEAAGLDEDFERFKANGAISTKKAVHAREKAPHTVEYLKDMIDQGVDKILVFSDHVAPAEFIAAAMGGACVTGKVDAETRMAHAKAFQSGSLKVLSATIGSMSTGLTLTAAHHVVFNDLSWTPADNAQAEARIRRIGQTKPCLVHIMHGSETDRAIYRVLASKSRDAQSVERAIRDTKPE